MQELLFARSANFSRLSLQGTLRNLVLSTIAARCEGSLLPRALVSAGTVLVFRMQMRDLENFISWSVFHDPLCGSTCADFHVFRTEQAVFCIEAVGATRVF